LIFHLQEISSSRNKSYEASLTYKKLAEEAILDRQQVMLKLKAVRDQWNRAETIDVLHMKKKTLSQSTHQLLSLESHLSAEFLASHALGDLSVESLRATHPVVIQGVLSKQSIKTSEYHRVC
jgi:hypothetical protein